MSEIVRTICLMADPAKSDWGAPSPVQLSLCGEPSIAAITFACVHEHVETRSACAGCSAEVQRVKDHLICRQCEESEQSHECEVVIAIRWLEGSQP